MKILITGGSGFIGGTIFYKLRSLGLTVFNIDKKVDYDLRKIYKTDADIVIHCAANLFDNFHENVALTRKVSEFARDARVIFTSSAAVYGNSNNAREEDMLSPYGEYGFAKLLEEGIIRGTIKNHVIFRLGNVYGQTTDHGIHHHIINGEKSLNNNGESIRDFVSVNDVAGAVISAIFRADISGIYNIASGVGTSIQSLYYKLNPSGPPHIDGGEKQEIKQSVLCIDKARKWGYNPEVL